MSTPDILSELDHVAKQRELTEANRRLLRQLAAAKAKTEDLVEATYQAAKDALIIESAIKTPRPRQDKRSKRGEVALWHLTDWQGAKVTTSYNSAVMRQRVMQFTEKAASITDIQRSDHPVRSCAVLFGGDMVEGLFNFATQPFEVDATLFEQWANVSALIADVVRAALATHDDVSVVSEWGNHGRIGSKRDAVPRADNFDRMCYQTARIMLASESRLTWQDSAEDIQKVEIGNYRAILLHGDETGRNGFVSESTFLKYLTSLKAGAFKWAFQDAYTGHLHTHNDRAMSDGSGMWYQTGSTESDNRYARNGLGSTANPSQRLQYIDPERGRITAKYQVWLD